MEPNQSIYTLIRSTYASLSKSEKQVADFVLLTGYSISSLTLHELASQTETSEPTVMRFAKKLGYSSFSDFKLHVAKSWGQVNASKVDEPTRFIDLLFTRNDSTKEIPAKVIDMTSHALRETMNLLDEGKFLEAIAMIRRADLIDIYGVGNSGSIASDLMNKLVRIGLKCRYFADNHVQQICACHLTDKDLAIAISHSGSTKDTVDTLHIAKNAGAMTISITNFSGHHTSRYSDVTLLTGDVETTFYSETTVSRISQLALVDMLYMGVLLSDFDRFSTNLDRVNKLVQTKNYE
ncbi:MAG: MurR/RpiR family transcriptional regulator [Erysipelotrichaceae bacterium]